jgi:hypothetical protein
MREAAQYLGPKPSDDERAFVSDLLSCAKEEKFDETDFWSLIDSCRFAFDSRDAKLHPLWEVIQPEIERVSREKLFLASEHYYRLLQNIHSKELWSAVALMQDHCSDDIFYNFCNGVITSGREVYDCLLANSDSPKVITDAYKSYCGVGVIFVITSVFEDKFGFNVPYCGGGLEAHGEWIREEERASRLPKCLEWVRSHGRKV